MLLCMIVAFLQTYATKPVKLNNTGAFTYYEVGINKKTPGFVLNGTITVAKLT
jgi:hypothetical protein